MSNIIFALILIFVVISAASLFIYLNPTGPSSNSDVVSNQSSQAAQNNSNQKIDTSQVYMSNCVNSTKKQAEEIENITNATEIESRIFNTTSSARSYLEHNWSNSFYNINGTQRDILNKTVVSVFEILTDRGRNFTLPILCDINGNIGNYSSCLLDNVPNIPSACYNLTINLSDCENEWANHLILDDIQYWITPPAGTVLIPSTGINNTSQTFNFTILSSRKRLESYGLEITERTFSPMVVDRIIFSSTKISKDGKGGSIVYKANLTNRTSVEIYSTAWFKKKCYDKYMVY